MVVIMISSPRSLLITKFARFKNSDIWCRVVFSSYLSGGCLWWRYGVGVVVGGGGGTYWKMKMKECSVSKNRME